jgi:DNA ligase (NAD+)
MARIGELGVATTATSPAGMPLCATIDEVIAAVEMLHPRRGQLGFGVDGAVIKADQPADRDRAGFSSRVPRWGSPTSSPSTPAPPGCCASRSMSTAPV